MLARLCECAACLLAQRRFHIFFLFLDAQKFSPVSVFSKNQSHCFVVMFLVWEQPDHCASAAAIRGLH